MPHSRTDWSTTNAANCSAPSCRRGNSLMGCRSATVGAAVSSIPRRIS